MSNAEMHRAEVILAQKFADGIDRLILGELAVLKPCPFCSPEQSVVSILRRGRDGRQRRVCCDTCKTLGPLVYYSDKRATAAWNSRSREQS